MKQRWLAMGLALLMTATAAGCGNSDSGEQEKGGTPIVSTQEKGGMLSVSLVEDYDYGWQEGVGDTYTFHGQKLQLSESTEQEFPALAKSVDEYNGELDAMYGEQASDLKAAVAAEMDNYSEEELEEYSENEEDNPFFMPYEYETKLLVKRADTNVLSVLASSSGYMGGAHPNAWYGSENFDVQTGKRLRITDAVTDTASFKKMLSDKLTKRYPDTEFFDLQGTLDSYLDEGGEYQDRMVWILGSQGVTVYFSPYELASYADGTLTATVYYSEQPSLFNQAYTKVPESYTVAIAPYETVEYDLDGDGTGENIGIGCNEDEYDYTESMAVFVGDKEEEVKAYFYSVDAYLVHTPNGNYLYADTVSDNDYHSLFCLSLRKNGAKLIEEADCGFASVETKNPDEYAYSVFTAPESFVLATKIDVLSTYSGEKTYHVGKDGMPESDDDMYRIHVGYHLDVVQELPVECLDDNLKPTGEKTKLQPGDALTLVQGDGENLVDVMAKDNKYYRITVEFDDEEWWQTIDGKKADDYFDMLYFAG